MPYLAANDLMRFNPVGAFRQSRDAVVQNDLMRRQSERQMQAQQFQQDATTFSQQRLTEQDAIAADERQRAQQEQAAQQDAAAKLQQAKAAYAGAQRIAAAPIGQKKPMALAALGPEGVARYAQNGIDIASMSEEDVDALAKHIEAQIGSQLGIAPVVAAKPKIDAVQPGNYTPESIAAFEKSGNYADLRRYEPPAKPTATPAAAPAPADGFGNTKIGDLQASIAAAGYSLPSGFRSKEQQASLLSGLLRKYDGLSPDDIAHLLANNAADYAGVKKATQIAAGIAGKVEFANQELKAFAPIAMDASAAVDRGSFVPMSKLIQVGQKNISDPDLKRLYVATQSILNAYNMLSARGGTDQEVRAHNRQVLMTADSPEAYQAAIEMIIKEGIAAGTAAGVSMDPRTYRQPEGTTSPPGKAPIIENAKGEQMILLDGVWKPYDPTGTWPPRGR
jgi:hypothetical protein